MKSWRKEKTLKPDFDKQDIPEFPATRFFDQLSFIGNEIVGCFVLETEKGIVLIDCMNPDEDSKMAIEKGFQDLDLDINNLEAIIISHGHGDHFGNAGYFKEKYGAKIYMSEIDYEFASHIPSDLPWESVTFDVDHYLVDGETLDFGSIHCVFTPGHSTGCFSFVIPVTDEGRQHQIALWGGSGILPNSNVDDYLSSWHKFSKCCHELHVDGEISTHPCLDMGLERLTIVRNIVNGVPNPFVLGEEGYQYYEKQFYDLAMKHKNR